MKKINKGIEMTAEWLLIIGGLNWGVSLFGMNLVTMLQNAVPIPMLDNVVYGLVGLSAIVVLYNKIAK